MIVAVTHKLSENTQRIIRTSEKTRAVVDARHRALLRVELMRKLDELGFIRTRQTDGSMYLEIDVQDLK